MTKQINTLADYVYTKFMEEEIAKAERGRMEIMKYI